MKHITSGCLFWIPGLSGAGKTSIGEIFTELLRERYDNVVFLDGDELREIFGATATNLDNYERETRLALALQYVRLCRMLSQQGHMVVIATISLFKEVHEWNRKNLPCYFEVYLKVSLEELRRRDSKGIYSRFDAGELTNVAGLDLSIDEPEWPDLTIEFDSTCKVTELANEIITLLKLGQKG